MIRRENWLLTEKFLQIGIKDENPNIGEDSITRCGFNLRHLLLWADDMSFNEAFNSKTQSFIAYINCLPSRKGDGTLSSESRKKIINDSKRFLNWVNSTGVTKKDKISPKTLSSLVPPKASSNCKEPVSVSYEEMLQLASFECGDNLVYQRDLACMCFAFLSGARTGAIESAPIKSIDLENMWFYQYPEWGVLTKNKKKAKTTLLPIPQLVSIVKKWDNFVRQNLPDGSLWYAPMNNHWGEYKLMDFQSCDNVDVGTRRRFNVIYEKAGMGGSFKSAHKFRHGHAVYSISKCKSMAEYQAVSRNLMHDSIAITDKVYADLGFAARDKIISSFVPTYSPVIEGDFENYLRTLCLNDRVRAIQILAESMKE